MEEVDNLSEFDMMGDWCCTITTFGSKDCINTIELTSMLLAF